MGTPFITDGSGASARAGRPAMSSVAIARAVRKSIPYFQIARRNAEAMSDMTAALLPPRIRERDPLSTPMSVNRIISDHISVRKNESHQG